MNQSKVSPIKLTYEFLKCSALISSTKKTLKVKGLFGLSKLSKCRLLQLFDDVAGAGESSSWKW